MKKQYLKPWIEKVSVELETYLLADSNHLENGVDEEAGVKAEFGTNEVDDDGHSKSVWDSWE